MTRSAVGPGLPVLVAAGGASWEADLVAALGASGSDLVVARRCVDVVELLALAATGIGRAALVAAGLRRLDADAVDRLHAAGVAPVALVPRSDGAAEDRMRSLGIEHTVPDDADASVIAGVVEQAVLAHGAAADARVGHGFGDPSTSMAVPPRSPDAAPFVAPVQRGRVVAVWGPTGAPGRTTLAVTLADELSRLGHSALLVDADVYGGTIAAQLGLLDESPGIAAACRLAGGTRLDATALAGLCWQLGPTLRVLTGIPIASRWTELRPAAVGSVLAAARSLADLTVVDCGFCLETDEELSFDMLAPRRNGATLAVLDDSDVIAVVGSADPIGMQRLVRALADLRDLDPPGARQVVLNRVRRGVVPGDPEAELVGALESFSGVRPAALLPYDREAADAATATGRSLGEACPGSALRRTVRAYATELGGPAPATRTGARRRPAWIGRHLGR